MLAKHHHSQHLILAAQLVGGGKDKPSIPILSLCLTWIIDTLSYDEEEANTIDADFVTFCTLSQIIAIARGGQCHPKAAEAYSAKRETLYDLFNHVSLVEK